MFFDDVDDEFGWLDPTPAPPAIVDVLRELAHQVALHGSIGAALELIDLTGLDTVEDLVALVYSDGDPDPRGFDAIADAVDGHQLMLRAAGR